MWLRRGKGKEKALKSFKRICVNSFKTSLCDVSQSIGDQIEERIATVNPLLSIPTMGINIGTKHKQTCRGLFLVVLFFSSYCMSRRALKIRVFGLVFPRKAVVKGECHMNAGLIISGSLCSCRPLSPEL